ncbi:MAG: D-alanyl-D-alanine carboxypeptidase [Glaciimonas sp.]|nr:D-alanyl-D-alanine carboxypeptidase [Glaciimonas sp.]
MKKLCAVFAAGILSLSVLTTAVAQTLPSPTIAARSWLLLDMNSNQVIASQDPDMRIEPASLTKIMTAYLTFAAIKDKKLALAQMVTVSEHAWKVDSESSKMFIEPRVPVSVNDLLYGLMVQSGNDAAVALAEAVAGTESAFVVLMNREAQRMGMKNTRFGNPHGLPDAENFSTAHDLSLLAAHIIADYPEFYKIDSTKYFTYNSIKQPNRNRLLWSDPSVDGMKTGHTNASGYSMIASAKRPNGSGQRRLLSVLSGATSDQLRSQESQKLLNWGFQNFDAVKLYAKGQPLATLEVWKGAQSQLKVGFDRDVFVTLPKGMADKVKPVLERNDPLVAPINQNAKIGTLKMMVDGKVVTQLPVLALEQVNQASIFGRAWDSLRLWIK